MFTRILEIEKMAPVQLIPERFNDFARSFATVRLVEQCATACEMLAEELEDEVSSSGMQAQVSECIAACAAFLGATVRESKHSCRYALLFREVCTETAEICARSTNKSAPCLEVMCRACLNLVEEDYACVSAN